MALSGSKNYAITRNDIISGALRKIGEFDQGEALSGPDIVGGALALNLMVKAWAAKGADIFLRQTLTLFLQKNQQVYTVGPDSSAEITASFVETTLSAAEASGQTVLSLTSSAGMSSGDRIGIKMDDNTIHWTTISTVPSSTSVQIATATDDDAASGNKVYAYSTRADLPLKFVYAYRRDTSDNDTPVDLIGEIEYARLSNKGAAGPVNQIWYRPGIDSGSLHVWPVDGGSSVDKLYLVAHTRPDDLDITSNNPEFPIEWGEALTYGLAARLAPEYGLDPQTRRMLNAEAEFMLQDMLNYDVENASVIFTTGR